MIEIFFLLISFSSSSLPVYRRLLGFVCWFWILALFWRCLRVFWCFPHVIYKQGCFQFGPSCFCLSLLFLVSFFHLSLPALYWIGLVMVGILSCSWFCRKHFLVYNIYRCNWSKRQPKLMRTGVGILFKLYKIQKGKRFWSRVRMPPKWKSASL